MNNELNHLEKQKETTQKKLEQRKWQLKKSKYYENKKLRKERTRNLIQKGALLDKYFETNHLSIEETEELLKIFSEDVNAKKPDQFKKE
ncbi:putative uncharacterized protein [Tetragenococcus halophilus subsp. halophilus]|uniref:DUF3847 domain-containing protein n=1 Tax=Tetragenococcus halophilus TaxID=51669 RepID=F1SZJ8_TETHA|nr:hypothetical protein [Tetragenococcus halophilus]BAJ84443.1 conserved hypothetical protein [Tetragenococcus halophilus]BAJ84469.1 conserved hypothetical protein [Tetragenococcus halophilus HO]GBD62046.1 putative uncharacterized protein [Tetragenococcus halophilus subsp. halophilus]